HARSATQGECSKTQPIAATKPSRGNIFTSSMVINRCLRWLWSIRERIDGRERGARPRRHALEWLGYRGELLRRIQKRRWHRAAPRERKWRASAAARPLLCCQKQHPVRRRE